MKKKSLRVAPGGLGLSLLIVSFASCRQESQPGEEPAWWEPAAEVDAPVAARFEVSVNGKHPALATMRREPQEGPITVRSFNDGQVLLSGRAKTIPARPGDMWVDLFVENQGATALRDVRLTFQSDAMLFDVNVDPFSVQPLSETLVGGIAANGVGHVALVVKKTDALTLTLSLTASKTDRQEANVATIVATPDGREVWSTAGGIKTLAIIDTATDSLSATLELSGHPSSLAVTPDGLLVLVTCADTNQLMVIDRVGRRVVQVLDETAGLGRDLRHVVVAPDGARAYVSAYVSDRVSSLRRRVDGSFTVEQSLSVGRRPLGLSVTSDSKTLFVAHYLPRGTTDNNETWVSLLQTRPLTLLREIVWRDNGNQRESACLDAKFGTPAKSLLFEGTATQLASVFLAPGGAQGWVPGLRVGPTALWELSKDLRLPGIARGTFSPAFLLFVDTRSAEVADRRVHPLVVDVPDAKIDFLRCAKLDYDSESVIAQPVAGEPDATMSNGAATPTGSTALSEAGVSRFVAFTPGGRRALVLSYTADEIQVFDATTHHPLARKNYRLEGKNPLGLAFAAHGSKAYVNYDNSLFVSVLDVSAWATPTTLPVASYVPFEYRTTARANNSFLTASRIVRLTQGVAEVPAITERSQISVLASDPIDPAVRRGRVLFSSSNPSKYPELTSSRQAACEACHPGGGHDGAVWATMEGERRTMSLRGGVFGRGWLHQSGTHQDIHEFVNIIVPERLGGSGLTAADSQALANYIAKHIPALQSPEGDVEAARRGKILFQAKCANCHSGATFSGGSFDAENQWGGGVTAGPQLFDVGTASAGSHAILPPFFTMQIPPPSSSLYRVLQGDRDLGANDVAQMTLQFHPRPTRPRGFIRPPSLVGSWDYSVHFHDGRYDSLRASIDHLNRVLQLGLSERELIDVEAYVKTL